MSAQQLTASQTVGPFFEICLTRAQRPAALTNVLVDDKTRGQRVRIQGKVVDGERHPVSDAMVEIWQANADGRYNHPADTRSEAPLDPAFTGFGRAETDEEGGFWFDTIKPGCVPGPAGQPQAPHIVVTVFARGMLNHVVTRLYFDDEPTTAHDQVLQRVAPERRGALVAQHQSEHSGVQAYQFDIILQGAGETPFFNV